MWVTLMIARVVFVLLASAVNGELDDGNAVPTQYKCFKVLIPFFTT
jgi:hypothetical protein